MSYLTDNDGGYIIFVSLNPTSDPQLSYILDTRVK